MPRLMRTAFMAAGLAGITACADSLGVRSDALLVRQAGPAMELTNLASARVYYFAAERDQLALLDWIPCVDPVACPAIEPSARRVIPFEDVPGYGAGARAIVVFHWRLVRQDSAFRPDSIRSLTLRLR